MIKRPQPGENEEDILRMQEEFLREKNVQPSAQIINLRKTEHQTTKRTIPDISNTRKPSKYARSRGINNCEKSKGSSSSHGLIMGDILEKNVYESDHELATRRSVSADDDDNVYFPKVIPSILGDIVEKKFDSYESSDTFVMPVTGFPVASKRDFTISKNVHSSVIKRKESINDVDMVPSNNEMHNTSNLNLSNKSFILTSQDATSIHNENVKLLSKMSEKQILEERNKLLKSLDTNLVDFIRNKRKYKELEVVQTKLDSVDINEDSKMDVTKDEKENLNIPDDTLWENDVLSHPQVNSWLHFDNLEKDKLEWMKGIEEYKSVNPIEPYEARFDFNGYLLPYTLDYTEENKILFHHGSEPHRPGYSVPELFELTRSTNIQQRAVALNTLAGILEHNCTGIYKDIIDVPLTKIFFIVRIAMDENKVNVLEPALRAMRHLIYNRIDEASLDALIGFEEGAYQPCLANDKSEIEEIESDESELKDFHLAEIDIIAALMRTDILQRLYYVIENLKPSFNCVQYSLQILIRLARDSFEITNRILEADHLMAAIVKYFLPSTSINFLFTASSAYSAKPILSALKFMRVLSLQSKEVGELLVVKYKLLEPLSCYVSSSVDGTYGLRLQIEAFNILSNLLIYNLGADNAMLLSPVVITTLHKHVHGTNLSISESVLSGTHAAVVIRYINHILCCPMLNLDSIKEQIYPLLKDGLQKWLSQASSFEDYTSGHLRLLSSLLDCCKSVLEIENASLKFLNDLLLTFANSNGFNMYIKNIISTSNLLSEIDDQQLFVTKNLMSLGSVICSSSTKVLPIFKLNSPIPFLATLYKLLLYINNKDISQIFINKLSEYLKQITCKPLYLTNNWFTRMEVNLVYCVVRLSATNNILESMKDVIYAVANRLCYILRVDRQSELRYLFNDIIFNKQWFTAERLFNLVSLSENDGFDKVLTNIEEIKILYSSVINSRQIHPRNITLKDWKEPILPRDWIYLPILSLYSRSLEVEKSPTVYGEHAKNMAQKMANEKENIIRCCLEWILFNEMCFPDILLDIDITDRFCRIMCVFLCDNSLFLDEKIKLMLNKCMQVIFKNNSKLNFNKELTGVHNFQDLYTQFLEQFQSVSYGDHTFAAYVLVPIAQKHNVKWRKLLWSEYAGALAYLNCSDSDLCYNLDEYLYPEETDESLIKCYTRALSSQILRPHSIPYKIAHHHVKKFKETIIANKNL